MNKAHLLTQEQSELLRTSIAQPQPCCTGTVQVPPKDLVIYYGKNENASRIDFLHASEESLERLTAACEPATFGVGHDSVYDESYRKAGKLSSDAFSPILDLANLGLVNIVRDRLLRGSAAQRTVRAELYNLNVYGEGSFFMAHVDTPRDEAMFGSLVIFYPTQHQGGALIMRQPGEGEEWSFDSAKILSESEGPRIGYAAFYSDIEHEVEKVTAGYRVTITYNLYFDDSLESLPPALSPGPSAFKTALESLLDDRDFLSTGGHLAFGLQYSYPLPARIVKARKSLESVVKYLKGSDAEIMQVAQELSLQASLWTLIKSRYHQYICEGSLPCYDGRYFESPDLGSWLSDHHRAKNIDMGADRSGEQFLKVHWITKPSRINQEKRAFMTYGNEPEMDYSYHSICIVLRIGMPGSRMEYEPSDTEEAGYSYFNSDSDRDSREPISDSEKSDWSIASLGDY